MTMDRFGTEGSAELLRLVAPSRGPCPPGLAEDVAQEAMLVVYRKWRTAAELDRPDLWVRRVCTNLAVSSFRRKMVEGPAGRPAHLTLETVTTPGGPLASLLRVLDIYTCRGYAGGLAWSPAGTRIAVAGVSRWSVGREVWSSLRDGSGWRREAARAAGPVTWQPLSD
jgi:hypothetical protein